jgi:hypothetical protein
MVDFMYLLLLLRLSQIPGGFKIIFSGQYCPDFPIPTWVLNHRTWRNLFRHAWGDYCLDKKVTKKILEMRLSSQCPYSALACFQVKANDAFNRQGITLIIDD